MSAVPSENDVAPALQAEREFVDAVLDSVPGVFYHFDEGGHLLRWNKNLERVTGYSAEELARLRPQDFFPDEAEVLFTQARAQGSAQLEGTLLLKDGKRVPYLFTANYFERNGHKRFIGVGLDLSASKESERHLRQERDYSEAILNALPGIFFHYDINGRFVRGNRNLETTAGYTLAERENMRALDFIAEEDRAQISAKLQEMFVTQKPGTGEAHYVFKDGRKVPYLFSSAPFAYEGQLGFVGVGIDISQHKQAEEMAQYLATHDELTELPNQQVLQDRLTQAIADAWENEEAGIQVALLHLNLDRFRVINDGYGHPFGDAVLKVVGKQLTTLIHDAGLVTRQGGDEFSILLPALPQTDDAYAIVRKVVESFQHPIVVQGREIYLSTSIGVAMFPQDGDSAEALISNADVAMYHAKDFGRNTYQFFTQQMSDATQHRIEMETQLRRAMTAKQLRLAYQPKVNLADGRIIGCEALLRWQHPFMGNVSPKQFIPIAEDSGLIVPIGNWALRTACQQAKTWINAGLPPTPVAVNISARQFLQQDVVAQVIRALEEAGLPPELLELELTESLLAHDVDKVIDTFRELKDIGIKLSIDDFGTGYSSLSYLKRFPIDMLKIDQSFVRNLLTEAEDANIVLSIIDLAHNLKFKVLAEGVETEQHCDFLRTNRCDEMQGFYFSHAITAEEFANMLRSHKQLN